MALVTRDFPPSLSRSKAQKRRKHIMLAGGREGPEVAAKTPRTARYQEQGSAGWTDDLAGGRTPEDARTQPPFLRSVVRDHRAYARGLMTVKEAIAVAEKAADYAEANPTYVPLIEFTGVTTDGKLASFTGRLLEPLVNTISKDTSADWAGTLRKLAEELRLIEAAVPRFPNNTSRPEYAFVPRVYLNMVTSTGREVSVPLEQMAVVAPVSRNPALVQVDVVGVYSPGPDDSELKMGGEVVKIGQPIRIPVNDVEYVTVDAPEFGQAAFMETPAFARSRGFLIELTESEMKRTRAAESRFIVPYDQVLRLRMIYPPAAGYTRTSSRAVESNETVEREIEAAKRHIRSLTEELAYKTLSRLSFDKGKNVIITDEVSGFRFGLEDASFEGATRPVMVWLPFVVRDEKGEPTFIPPQGEYSLVNRPVTVIDYLRLLRAAKPEKGLRALRRFRLRRASSSAD
jgi:hypothetical protein